MTQRIFLTGASGFIGANLLHELFRAGYQVLCLKRRCSNQWRSESETLSAVSWLDVEDTDWGSKAIDFDPEIIIHGSWNGVDASRRSDWLGQMDNVRHTAEVLSIAESASCRKVIGLGSQAEYGRFEGVISESAPANPDTPYGIAKLMAMEATRSYCSSRAITWHWLRLFPLFGEKESFSWFIPTLVRHLVNGTTMPMTAGEQRYAYLYIRDLCRWIMRMMAADIESGVYNVSSSTARPLKDIVEAVTRLVAPSQHDIQMGAIPYRQYQSMLVQGMTQKLELQLGDLNESDFPAALAKTVAEIKHRTPYE
jgi:Nucleoside-diphosphate-sugar epimerases